jgi:hemerythrin-like domain-containing protein
VKITDRFVGDHKTFRKLMSQIDLLPPEITSDDEQRRLIRLIELFVDHLLIHAWGEETFFYPRIASLGEGFDDATQDRLKHEHTESDLLAWQMEAEARKPRGGKWREVYDRFKTALTAHMTEEENMIFPESEKILGAETLEQISQDVERRRREAPPIRRHQSL